jgi:hypothetical protein
VTIPQVDLDPYTDESITDFHPPYEALRGALRRGVRGPAPLCAVAAAFHTPLITGLVLLGLAGVTVRFLADRSNRRSSCTAQPSSYRIDNSRAALSTV